MTWVQIVNDFLKKNKCDCLKNTDKECYCVIGNLFQCAFDCSTFDCVPGKIKDLSDDYKAMT